ncbi:hypothetical protein D3C81_1664880 [compost metagenome]
MVGGGIDAHQPGFDGQLEMAEGVGQAVQRLAAGQAQAVLVGQVVDLFEVVQLRQAPQPAPEAAGRPPVKQDGAFVVGQQRHQRALLWQLLARLGHRVADLLAEQVRLATDLERAQQATGLAAGAQGGAQVHHRLGVVIYPAVRGIALGVGP